MAVVSLNSGAAANPTGDNLLIIYPNGRGTETRAGEVSSAGSKHITEVFVTLASLPTVASGNKQILAENVTIPALAFIEKVEVFVSKETAGVNANLDLGFVKAVDRTTEVDFNGLLAAADAFNGGTDLGTVTEFVVGTTEAGAVIGTQLPFTSLITANAETADWTAGVLRIRIHWSVVLLADD
jgi:hypothetical protein